MEDVKIGVIRITQLSIQDTVLVWVKEIEKKLIFIGIHDVLYLDKTSSSRYVTPKFKQYFCVMHYDLTTILERIMKHDIKPKILTLKHEITYFQSGTSIRTQALDRMNTKAGSNKIWIPGKYMYIIYTAISIFFPKEV